MSKSAEVHRFGLPYNHPMVGSLPASKAAEYVAQTCKARERRQRLVVDAGCGAGRNTVFLLEKGFRVVALDVSERNLGTVRRMAGAARAVGKLKTHALDLVEDRIPVEDGKAYAVLDVWVLGSVILRHDGRAGAKKYLKEVHRILKPGGLFVCEFETLKPRRCSKDLKAYCSNLVKGCFTVVSWEAMRADYAQHFEGRVRARPGPALFVVAQK